MRATMDRLEGAFTLARRQFVLGALTVALLVAGLGLVAAAFGGSETGLGLGQLLPGAGGRGEETALVVTGYGQATAPADMATVQLLLSKTDFFNSGQRSSDEETAPGEAERTAAEVIVAALVERGIPPAEITVTISPIGRPDFFGTGGPPTIRIEFSAADPEVDTLNGLIAEVGQEAQELGLWVDSAGVGYGIKDCAALQRLAREAALNDARSRAEAQADLMGTPLGALREISETPAGNAGLPLNPFPATPGGCGALAGTGSPTTDAFGPSFDLTVPDFNPAAPAETIAYAQISLTYAIPDPDAG